MGFYGGILERVLTVLTVLAGLYAVMNFGTITAAIAIFIANLLTSVLGPLLAILSLAALVWYWRRRRYRRWW